MLLLAGSVSGGHLLLLLDELELAAGGSGAGAVDVASVVASANAELISQGEEEVLCIFSLRDHIKPVRPNVLFSSTPLQHEKRAADPLFLR